MSFWWVVKIRKEKQRTNYIIKSSNNMGLNKSVAVGLESRLIRYLFERDISGGSNSLECHWNLGILLWIRYKRLSFLNHGRFSGLWMMLRDQIKKNTDVYGFFFSLCIIFVNNIHFSCPSHPHLHWLKLYGWNIILEKLMLTRKITTWSHGCLQYLQEKKQDSMNRKNCWRYWQSPQGSW